MSKCGKVCLPTDFQEVRLQAFFCDVQILHLSSRSSSSSSSRSRSSSSSSSRECMVTQFMGGSNLIDGMEFFRIDIESVGLRWISASLKLVQKLAAPYLYGEDFHGLKSRES